jgi:hypothetical protein
MSYAFIRDVPFNEKQYAEIRSEIGEEIPKGLVAHLAIRRSEGLRYIDVWDTQADWERFRDQRVSPAVQKMMSTHSFPPPTGPLPVEIIEVIDAMIGPTGPA